MGPVTGFGVAFILCVGGLPQRTQTKCLYNFEQPEEKMVQAALLFGQIVLLVTKTRDLAKKMSDLSTITLSSFLMRPVPVSCASQDNDPAYATV